MSAKLKTVLIADSDRKLVDTLAIQCHQLGLTVFCAYDARTALKAIIEHDLDLICLDVDMTARDQLSVCEVISIDETYSKIPLIALATRKDQETTRRCGDMCAYQLTKSDDLFARISSVICELIDVGASTHNCSPNDKPETTNPAN